MLKYRQRPWLGAQTWNDIVFVHWPVSAKKLRPLIPEPLIINEYEGTAWISIVLFTADNTRFRSLPESLSYKSFQQLNFRTYVSFGKEERGVYFFSLYADDPLFVSGGQLVGLPFKSSKMNRLVENGQSLFTNKTPAGTQEDFIIQYSQSGKPFVPKRNTIAYSLTERYCIWTVRNKNIIKYPITHLSWILHDVNIDIRVNKLIPESLRSPDLPIAHYAQSKTAYIHPMEKFGIYHN